MSTKAENHPPASDPRPDPDLWTVLKSVAETAALFGFFSTVLGWSYLGSYFSRFGFRPMELEVSSSVVSLFAINVLSRSLIVWVVTAVVAIAPAIIRIKKYDYGSRAVLLLLCLATLGLFKLGSYHGEAAAKEDMWLKSSRLPSVGLFVKSARPGYPSCVSVTPTSDCRLLLHSKGVYYLIRPFVTFVELNPSKEPVKNLEIYAVPESQVQFAQYERGVR